MWAGPWEEICQSSPMGTSVGSETHRLRVQGRRPVCLLPFPWPPEEEEGWERPQSLRRERYILRTRGLPTREACFVWPERGSGSLGRLRAMSYPDTATVQHRH